MPQWFIQSAAETLGPYTPAEVLDMVRRGQVTQETKMRKDDSAWFPAAEIGGLFEAAVKPTVRYLCPVCGRDVKQPPCACAHCGREIDVARKQVTEHRIEVAGRDGKPTGGPAASMQGWLSRIRRRGSS